MKLLWGTDVYHGHDWRDFLSDLSMSFYQVNPVQTEKLYRIALEVRRADRKRDRVGSVLRDRDDLPVSGEESEARLRRRDCAGRRPGRKKERAEKQDCKRRVLRRKSRGDTAGKI